MVGCCAASAWSHSPSSPHTSKKKKPHQGKSLGMFLKRRKRGILELSTRDGSVELIFVMSCVRIRECCESKSWWRFCRCGLVLQSCGVSSPHSSPLSLRDLLVATGYKCWDMKGECCVVLCVSEGTQKLQIRHKTLRPKFGAYGKIFGLPWDPMRAALVS